MTASSDFEKLLMDAADATERKRSPEIAKLQAETAECYRPRLGFSDEQIAELMQIPAHLLFKS